jgi:phosphate/sulfate permease
MRNLGNRITLHSPSRGFTMELGSAITVIMATKLSTSHTFPALISSLIIVR